MRKIGIVGMSESQRHAPFREDGWEWWGLAWDPQAYLYHRVYDIHDPWCHTAALGWDIPLYVQKGECEAENVYRYPIEEVVDDIWPGTFPRADQTDYFQISITYLIAHALYERVDMIGLWGVDMHEPAYVPHRPKVEYMLGIAQGRGIRVYIGPGSDLLRYVDQSGVYPKRYGWAA